MIAAVLYFFVQALKLSLFFKLIKGANRAELFRLANNVKLINL
jgi:hypothetical protein